MAILLLATLFSSAFGLVLRDALGRRCNPWLVGLVNYITATAIQVGRYALSPAPAPWQARSVALGAATGVFYALNFLLFIPLLERKGVSITSAMLRLAVIFPILASLWLWGERLNLYQGLGLALSLIALPLLTVNPSEGWQGLDRRATGLLLLLLLGNGASMVLTKGYQMGATPDQDAPYLASLFGAAMLISGAAWMGKRHGSSPRDLLPGVGLGLTNALANWGLVSALGVLPGVLVFPVYSAVGLVFTALLARWLFSERVTRLELSGMAVAVIAVALANLG